MGLTGGMLGGNIWRDERIWCSTQRSKTIWIPETVQKKQ